MQTWKEVSLPASFVSFIVFSFTCLSSAWDFHIVWLLVIWAWFLLRHCIPQRFRTGSQGGTKPTLSRLAAQLGGSIGISWGIGSSLVLFFWRNGCDFHCGGVFSQFVFVTRGRVSQSVSHCHACLNQCVAPSSCEIYSCCFVRPELCVCCHVRNVDSKEKRAGIIINVGL